MYERFDEFLAQQIINALPPIDLLTRRDEWLEALDDLYAKIQTILQPYIASQRITFRQSSSYISEEELGKYPVTMASITPYGDMNSKVELNPMGTFIIGARGRVDMVGPSLKTVKLMLVEKNRLKVGVQAHNSKLDDFAPMPPENADETEWVWKIATPPPTLSYLELTESNFLDALMFVMEH